MKTKPEFLNEEGMTVSPFNGLKQLSNLANLARATKYDLRNYSEKDSLALILAYLANKTWIEPSRTPGVIWCSTDGAAKRTGRYSWMGIGKPILLGMAEKVASLLKRKYSKNPEKLKDFISVCKLSDNEIDDYIDRSKGRPFYFRTSSKSEVNKCPSLSEDQKDYYLEMTIEESKPTYTSEGENALQLGRLYLSDIASRAYSELTRSDFSKQNSFIERVAKSIDSQQLETNLKTESLLSSAANSIGGGFKYIIGDFMGTRF